ncbi:unnamed protein product [Prorocentrum cordatum]|uniref:Uncharacterized protein n=1 Tax=Prorocentrum cordatum TaxID=2364126 RepID=A0ABN9TVK7_9DINO|nr:unnamed protein product [Polarella glacialis]
MCWTGSNAMPVHLQLCLRTIRRNADVPVILVTPKNVLRLRGLFDLLDTCDAVGYDGSAWNEHIGVSAMGPFKPQSDLTTLWFNALHGKLAQRWADVQARQTDVFYWQEILRDIVLPASLIHRERISRAMQIHNPEQDALWSERPCAELLGAELDRCHLLVLNNAKYGQELGELSEALEFRGALWSTGMVQVDLRPITEAVEKLAGMVRVEARARRSLEAAVETLLIRAGEGREDSQLQDAGVSPRQGGGSLQASVLRLEQEAYRSRQLEQKAIADNEMLQLTVQSLSRDVAKAQVDAQESGKAAAAAAIGEDVDRIQSALTTVSNSTQERIRLLEEKLGLEGADGEPRNGEGALEAGAASPAQRFSGKSPRGYIQDGA